MKFINLDAIVYTDRRRKMPFMWVIKIFIRHAEFYLLIKANYLETF